MAEQALNTLDTQSVNAGLDLDGINDPMDALGAFDITQLDKDGTDPGDPPAKKQMTSDDLRKRYQMQMQDLKNFGEVGVVKIADQSRNKFQAARVVEFDAKKHNIDRYLGYGKSTFNKIGFSPFIDNEKNFNQNTNIWQDFGRMTTVFGSLAYEGGVSGYRSIGGMLNGDDFYTPDDKTAQNFARLQSIGMSTKNGGLNGIGAFVNNFALNTAYTVGVGMSILAEEAALFAITTATRGATGGIAAMRTAANIARFSKGVKQAYNTKAVGNILTGSVQLAKSLSKVGDAKDFYTAIKAGGSTLGKGALQFINPFTRTADDLVDIAKGSTSVRNMSNLAKAKQTFGSFYRDIRDNNLALSESKLEGGSARIDKLNELLSKYEEENGKPPEGEELERIYQQAEDTGYGVTAINFPMILMTNRIVLDGLFKFRGFKNLDEAAELAGQGIGFKKGTGYFDALGDSWLKRTKQSLTNPKAYIGMGFGYFRRNFAEGIQENLQNVTSNAVSSYYDNVYKDPTLGGFEYGAGHAWKALTDEFTSSSGLETFASGFLMGGFMGKAQNLFFKDVPNIYYKVAQPQKLAEYKKNKLEARQNAIAGLNELYSNPLKYFNSHNESAVVQKHTSDVMNQAEDEGDAKTFQDAKDLKMFDHIFTALDNGNFNGLIENYKELSKLDSKELANFLGIQESSKANEKLQEVVTRAEQIKDRYETINNQFKNPFAPNKLNRKTPEFKQEAIAYRSFEAAKKTAIASQYGFDRAVERMNGLYSDLSSNRPVNKSSSTDITVLTDLETLDSEIALLDSEVKSYDQATDKEQKKIGEKKKAKLERMMDYRDKLRTHLEKMSDVEKEENGQITIQFSEETVDPLKESYKSYLREIAALNNDYIFDNKIDDSFVKLLDYYKLNQDARNYNKVLNTLLDPGNLYRHAERINAKYTQLFENQNADTNERIERSHRMVEVGELLKAVAAQGVMLDPKELQDFIKSGKKPTTFIDAATLKDLDTNSVKYAAIQAILEIDDTIKEQTSTTEATTTTPTTKEQPTAKPEASVEKPTITTSLDPELQVKLEDAYNQYLEENDLDMSFDDFVTISPRAARIKAEFNKGKGKPAAEKPGATTGYVPLTVASSTAPATTTETPSAPVSTDTKADIEKSIFLKKENLSNAPEFAQKAIAKIVEQLSEDVRLKIVKKAYDGVTATFIAAELGITTEQVRSVRSYYGVPDVADKDDYAKWKNNIDKKLSALEGAKPAAPVLDVAAKKAELEEIRQKAIDEANKKFTESTTVNGKEINDYTIEQGQYGEYTMVHHRRSETASSGHGTSLELNVNNFVNTVRSIEASQGKDAALKYIKDELVKLETSFRNSKISNAENAYKNGLAALGIQTQAEPTVEETKPTSTPGTDAATGLPLELIVEPVPTPTEKTGSQKAQELIDSVSSIRDLPDINKADSGPITVDLAELISRGQAKAKDINEMLSKKRAELLQKISPKDLQKGDIVTFVNGKKGFVQQVTNNSISVKIVGSQDPAVSIPVNNMAATINNIEQAKLVSMDVAPAIEVSPQDKTEVKASQDAKSSFTENSASVKEMGEKAAKSAGTDNLQNLNNLLQNIGCKTGK